MERERERENVKKRSKIKDERSKIKGREEVEVIITTWQLASRNSKQGN